MINNYKAQRNVRAELGGAVDLGHPVSLYIKEDEVKITGSNVFPNGDFEDDTVGQAPSIWVNSGMNPFVVTTDNATKGSNSLNMNVDGNGDKAYIDIPTRVGQQYKIMWNRIIPNHSSTNKISFRIGTTSDEDSISTSVSWNLNNTTGQVYGENVFFVATETTTRFTCREDGDGNDANLYIDNITCYEVSDHSYKLMAVNDAIPSQSVNTEAVGSELIGDTGFADASYWDTPTGWAVTGNKAVATSASNNTRIDPDDDVLAVSGKVYKAVFTIDSISEGGFKVVVGGTEGTSRTSPGTYEEILTATSAAYIYLRTNSTTSGTVDNFSVKEVFGYDYYNAPAYKFGIVSSVYDQSTGAMKTSGVAGDEVDVTVQGECTLRKSGTYSLNKDRLIARIFQEPSLESFTPSSIDGDYALPNSFGVTSETTSSSNTQPIILWQGVEFSEHFVHKNSLQVMAKCSETITKFRPVSLYLDSNGDLLCRHDDIPAELPDADTDHTGVDPGKWGVAELGGVSGDIIPVTVAGKTHINTNSGTTAGYPIRQLTEGSSMHLSTETDNYLPNALGTVMADNTGTNDVPITIFGGTPIGTITDWKRTIKVTAKANGTINDFTAVSLYLDQYGNYKCISDEIPNLQINQSNGIWCDFRKWGVAQNNASDGEDVEIIVQGRTRVRNSLQGANKGDFVRKIDSNGYVSGTETLGFALSSLGIVEKEARIADGAYGVIIIF